MRGDSGQSSSVSRVAEGAPRPSAPGSTPCPSSVCDSTTTMSARSRLGCQETPGSRAAPPETMTSDDHACNLDQGDLKPCVEIHLWLPRASDRHLQCEAVALRAVQAQLGQHLQGGSCNAEAAGGSRPHETSHQGRRTRRHLHARCTCSQVSGLLHTALERCPMQCTGTGPIRAAILRWLHPSSVTCNVWIKQQMCNVPACVHRLADLSRRRPGPTVQRRANPARRPPRPPQQPGARGAPVM